MRNKCIVVLVVGLFFTSCNQEKEIKSDVSKAIENTIEEPTDPKDTEVWEPIPPTVEPAKNNQPPSDAIVLFNGADFGEWVNAADSTAVTWILDKEKRSMTTFRLDGKDATIQTKRNFGDVQLHLEWKSSTEIKGEGQHRSNSGVFIQKRYEVQILDNNDNDTYANGQVGAIYKQAIPLAKALVPTGEWNTYDIIYHAPEFNAAGDKTKPATITVLHNGVLIQDHFKIKGTVEYIGFPKNIAHGKAPIALQDHGGSVSYRNVWVREL